MIKYQQQHPTNSLLQSPLVSTSQLTGKSFKQRINQLKAKVKPSLGVASIDSNSDHSQIPQARLPSQQPKINIIGVNKVLSPMSQFNDLENLSEKKVIDMRVSYRATRIKDSQSRQRSLQVDVRQYLSLNKVSGKLLFPCSEKQCKQIQGKRIKNEQKRKLEQYNKQNKNSNIQRNTFEIQDILITNYKSPNKTDRSLGSTMKIVNHRNSKDNLELNLLGADLSKLYTKQTGKEENKHIKKISHLNLSSNISIDVRQCSARYNTEYGGLIEGKKNQKKKKENNSTSRHMKTQSATYRIK